MAQKLWTESRTMRATVRCDWGRVHLTLSSSLGTSQWAVWADATLANGDTGCARYLDLKECGLVEAKRAAEKLAAEVDAHMRAALGIGL